MKIVETTWNFNSVNFRYGFFLLLPFSIFVLDEMFIIQAPTLC